MGNEQERIEQALRELEAGVVRYEAWQLKNRLIDEKGELTKLGIEFRAQNERKLNERDSETSE